MPTSTLSRLKRIRHPMTRFVSIALKRNGLMDAYLARPAYQQNDYIAWITRAKREETAEKRLKQMLAELKQGDSYMNMAYAPARKRAK